ncbi:DNA mismatch repair endonuclease MutL [Aliidiomarina indica]|uniref:DNA mismatch repair endonuclease MutL n=1 Tax=Aliidiomarina indica TaxID=2749147 RepID=UPI00188F529D|nr:DNA mismatch repair endonuclease MutL [Aliidiomarina indica]
MPIQLLPPQLANQIAAGEVVERPASVVKELVENSLDAGATEIRVDIEKGGARRIRVRDNGSGIAKDELTLALSRHATSKIATLDDLEAILSLGFRGEALASISSVSRLRLTSRTVASEEAWAAFCEGRDMQVAIEPASHPIGSTVDVEDLFFNTPARRKFMRTEKTEFGHIDEVIRRIALARSDVTIVLTHNHQVLRQYQSVKDEHQNKRLQQVAGRRFAEEAVYLTHQDDTLSLRGWVSPPQVCRHQGDIQYMYVNGRMMRDKLLNHAVRQAYGESLPDDRQPTFILYLTLPAHDVDVNVHPAKHEVRFHQARQVHDFVLGVVRSSLSQVLGATDSEHTTTEYQHGYATPARPAEGAVSESQLSSSPSAQGFAQASSSTAPNRGDLQQSPFFPIRRQAQTPHSAYGSATEKDKKAQAVYQQMWPQEATPTGSNRWQLLAIHAQWFGLLQMDDKLGLIDVRNLQRQLIQQRLLSGLKIGLTGQPLLLPLALSDKETMAALFENQSILQELGILLEKSGRSVVQIKQVPSVIRHGNLSEVIPALVNWICEHSLTCLSDMDEATRLRLATWLSQFALIEALPKSGVERVMREADEAKLPWANDVIELPWQNLVSERGDQHEPD